MDPTDSLTIDPLSALPAPWLAAIEAYAPTVLAWLLIATVLVHLLVPIARAVERWAVASSVTWDDGPARRFAEIVEWAAGATTAILAFVPRLGIGGLRETMRPIARHPSEMGARSPGRSTMRPPPSDAGLAIALVIAAAALSAALSGCGLTPVQAARHGLAGTARIGASIDRVMAAERLRVSASIRDRTDATRAEHDAAMQPFDEALEITVDVRDAHLAAQEALDAVEHGQEREWRPLMTCVFSATSRLVGVAARRIEPPPEVGEVLQILAGLAQGACPEPEREREPDSEREPDPDPETTEGGAR